MKDDDDTFPPGIPQERPGDRPPPDPDHMTTTFTYLDLDVPEFCRRFEINQRRCYRWLAGDEPAPRWFEGLLDTLMAMKMLKGTLQVIPEQNRPELVTLTLFAAGNVAETWTGSRWDAFRVRTDRDPQGAAPPPPAYVCPHCGFQSWNRNDAEHGYCGKCHRYAAEDPFPAHEHP